MVTITNNNKNKYQTGRNRLSFGNCFSFLTEYVTMPFGFLLDTSPKRSTSLDSNTTALYSFPAILYPQSTAQWKRVGGMTTAPPPLMWTSRSPRLAAGMSADSRICRKLTGLTATSSMEANPAGHPRYYKERKRYMY